MSNLRKAWNLYKLMKSQWKPYKELKELQEKKLRAIVRYAYQNIPLYHEKFKTAGTRPEEIKTIEDLTKLPFTTKSEIQANFPEKVIAPHVDLSKCWTPRTSGSTGKPLTIVYDEQAEDFEKATALRPNLSCGQGLLDKWIVITSPHHIKDKKRWFQRVGFFNPINISMFLSLKEQISKIEQIRPDAIDGYSSAIYLLARGVQKVGADIQPKIVFGSAEFLTGNMRKVINSTFGVQMFDQFGGVEMGRTAWECPEYAGYHIDVEAVVMEFIQDGKQVTLGERGEIVYTNLYNYAMPFIRYKSEDVGISSDEKCPCGRGLPLMKVMEGRKDSFIKTPNGRVFPQMTFWSIMRTFSESSKIKNFKVIQKKIDEIKIQIVPGKGFTEESSARLKEEVNNVLGKEVKVNIEIVEEILRERSGKIRSVVSNIRKDKLFG